jgi:hypothetical protein
MRKQQVQAEKIPEMKNSRRRRNRIPARMSENFGIGSRTFYPNRIGTHREKISMQHIGHTSEVGKF